MFEKEAEEWVKENMDCCKTDNSVNQSIPYFDDEERCCAKSAFQDGAEFGYNKANEWHYVKDELPSESAMLLLARKTVNGVQALIGYYKSNQFEVFNEKSCKMQNIDSVFAWKEIVLPELKENE